MIVAALVGIILFYPIHAIEVVIHELLHAAAIVLWPLVKTRVLLKSQEPVPKVFVRWACDHGETWPTTPLTWAEAIVFALAPQLLTFGTFVAAIAVQNSLVDATCIVFGGLVASGSGADLHGVWRLLRWPGSIIAAESEATVVYRS